jgi:hypothetical protein
MVVSFLLDPSQVTAVVVMAVDEIVHTKNKVSTDGEKT